MVDGVVAQDWDAKARAAELVERARSLIDADELANADVFLRLALEIDPASGAAYGAMARLQARSGKKDEALESAGFAIDKAPNDAEAWWARGDVRMEAGDVGGAMSDYSSAVSLAPRNAALLDAFASLLLRLGRIDDAVLVHRDAVRIEESNPRYWHHFGRTLARAGQFEAARDVLEGAVARDPKNPDVVADLVGVLVNMAAFDDAVAAAKKATDDGIDGPLLQVRLGLAHRGRGRTADALKAFRRALTLKPGDEVARHMVASLTGVTTVRTPVSVVLELYDNRARSYEKELIEEAKYRSPGLLHQVVRGLEADGVDLRRILDLGTGTGMSGVALREVTDFLKGADVCPSMVDEAKAKGVYNELGIGDVVAVLKQDETTYDLIAGLEILDFFGQLQSVMTAIRKRLRTGGHAVLTLTGSQIRDVELTRKATFRHSAAYVRRISEGSGFTVERCDTEALWVEDGFAVDGIILVLKAV